ncbi:hypothetical protein CDV55_107901 [Aspergillus turcosus]|uniref:Amino acid transporter transmembrane domain-containing protein n=1 Tax=Aspergillus turcosus TaxID=1245748 RepID=A0A397I7P9_9EURO|nr:hypothetical protein CDV55_107901 [Aspergillus turcosus]RLM00361.1 hypothetical protein CFD26_103169 [Aspergillus turcosus]
MLKTEQVEAHGAYDSEQASPRAVAFDDDGEIFKKTDSGSTFARWVGVLSLPSALYALGAAGGSISIVAWGCFNTYCFVILGNFRMRHPHCHSIADMAHVAGGIVAKEATGLLFIIAYVLVTGSGIIGVSTALNALSHHAACTVWWSFLGAAVIIATASIRKLEHAGWLTYVGFLSIYAALLIVVIGVTTRHRPAAAPQDLHRPGIAAAEQP